MDSQHNAKYETVIRGVWNTFSPQQRSTHTASVPVLAGSVHAHTQTKPYRADDAVDRAGAVVSRKI